jgi:DNA-binding SARP family transcriptional activator/tetratricopeptide (TPR) repeat protein
VEILLLGPVQVRAAGRYVPVGSPQRRAVLAALAVDADRPVPAETLIDRVWGDLPPAQVRSAIWARVTHIRHVLAQATSADSMASGTGGRAAGAGPAGGAPAGDVGLVLQPGGYVLRVDPDRVDLHRFRRLVAAGRRHGKEDAEKADLIEQALGLWAGDPLAGIASQWAERMRRSWNLERLDAVIDWARAALRLGRYDRVVPVVREMAEAHPLSEPLAAVMVRALAADGRPSEALEWYAATAARLVTELGIPPGPELQRLQRALLHGQPILPAAPAPRPSQVIPRQLPSAVHAFTGRQAELSQLDAVLSASAPPPHTAMPICAVSGTAGVGKSALVVHWAHQARARFPDGQLYINLRGYDPEQPITPADALTRLLTGLGLARHDIPAGLDDRAARYRTEIADRRILVVLDNAASVEQVRPLLPGTASATVVVTSRDSLSGLIALHGAHRVDLDLLPEPYAIALLHRLVGARVQAEPEAATALAQQCVRLPLALRVAAELAVSRPAASLADLVNELTDEQQRLDLLDGSGDPRSAVCAVFSWSYRHLPAAAGQAFRLLGLHPGPDIDLHAAAALTGTTLRDAGRLLQLLARANLIHSTRAHRYAMHDLLRAYAAHLAQEIDGKNDRRTRLERLFDHYLGTAAIAMDHLYPHERHRRPPSRTAPGKRVPITDATGATQWLDTERNNLLAAINHTARHGWRTHADQLVATLWRYFDIGGYHSDASTAYSHTLDAAGQAGDRAAQGAALHHLGRVCWRLADYDAALAHFQNALAIRRETHVHADEADTLNSLGNVYQRLGRYRLALEHYEEALAIRRTVGDRAGEGSTLGNIGIIHQRMHRYNQARYYYQQALAIRREVNDRVGEAAVLANLGEVYQRLGRFKQARYRHRQALVIFRAVGDRAGEGYSLANLGEIERQLGNHALALRNHQEAITLARQVADRSLETEALNRFGATLTAIGRAMQATTQHESALALAKQTGIRYEEAHAHTGLGHARRALGDHGQACRHWHEALTLYTALGVPDAENVRAHLGALSRKHDTGTNGPRQAPRIPDRAGARRVGPDG